MNPFVAEFVGTMILVTIGDGVCANVCLKGTKGYNSGWLVITTGWATAVFVGVMCTAEYSGAHLNPAVTVGLSAAGKFGWETAAGYIVAQLAGAMVGAVIVYVFYIQHFKITDDAEAKLGTFCTAPQVYGTIPNLIGEVVATFVLVFAVLLAVAPTLTESGTDEVSHQVGLGAVGALPVALVVFSIGLGLGGTTGYAINPARDLGPRIAHAVLPIPGKRDSNWGYAWIPVVGPLLGGVLAALLYRAVGLL